MKKIDLGKYDLNQLLRNPMTIHKIQDNLRELKGTDLLTSSFRNGASEDLKGTIKEIITQYHCNSKLITKIVGKETLNLIEQFEGITLADDIKDVL